MTLFDAVSKQEIFAEVIATFYPDGKDPATIEILRKMNDWCRAGGVARNDDGIGHTV